MSPTAWKTRLSEPARAAAVAAPSETAGRVVLRLLLLGYAFFIPLWVGGAQIFGYTAALVALVFALQRGGTGVRRADWVWAMALFAVFSAIAAFVGWNPARAVPRLNRLLLLPLVVAPAVAFAGTPADNARQWSAHALFAFLAGATLKACYDLGRIPLSAALGEWLYGLGNMRDPQFYMSALLLWIALGRESVAPSPRVRALSLVVAAAGLVLHFKRGVWLAFGLSAALLCLICRRRVFVALTLAAALALLLPPVRARLAALETEFGPRASRRVLWTRIAPRLIRDHPWGIGRGVLTNRDLQRYAKLRETKLNHLHNNWLQIAVESGWGGVAAWTVWMVGVGIEMARNAARAARQRLTYRWAPMGVAAVYLGLMLNGVVEYNFGDSEIYMWFLLLFGLTRLWRVESVGPTAAASAGEPLSAAGQPAS